MKPLDVARAVVAQKQAHLIRDRKDAPGEYDARPYGAGKKKGWVLFDLTTASAVCNVHAALNETNRASFAALPLRKMVAVAWKLVR